DELGPFVHLPQYNVVVCRLCRYAVVAKEIPSHLLHQIVHQRQFTSQERQDIKGRIEAIPGILKTQEALQDFQYPPTNTPVIPFIEPPRPDGMQCIECSRVFRQKRRIQQHCREEHGW
ncbi:hypothetical protein B0J13DRAFT_659876, partial [Dactylonectria estremocensis]